MEDPYVWQEILLRLDINDLPSFCASNQKYQQICQSYKFWEQYFAHHGLLLLEEESTIVEEESTIVDYIQQFLISQKILKKVTDEIENLKNQARRRVKYLITELRKVNDFNVDGIDLSILRKLKLDQMKQGIDIFDFTEGSRTTLNPKVEVIFDANQNQFLIHFGSNRNIKFYISEDAVRTLLYILLSRGYSFKREIGIPMPAFD